MLTPWLERRARMGLNGVHPLFCSCWGQPLATGYVRRMLPTLFARDDAGGVAIDNNASEREMKRIVLNRKNSLFVGHEHGGATAAILSSLTSTCRRHDIDPQRYLTQLLANLPDTPVSKLDRWLPDEWKRRDSPPPAALARNQHPATASALV